MPGREIAPDLGTVKIGRVDGRDVVCAGLIACAAVTTACLNPTYHHAACSVHGECPSGYLCIANFCESMSSGVLDMHLFDAAGLQAGDADDMTVDAARDALTPNAYTYGGLVAHGLQGVKLWEHGDTSWSKLDGVTATGAGLWSGETITTGSQLDYLGVVGDTTPRASRRTAAMRPGRIR